MPNYYVTAQRTFTFDYGIKVEADNEEHARVIVEQHNDELEAWENTMECALEWCHELNEETPHVFEIRKR